MSIANFSKSYANSSIVTEGVYENHATFEPNVVMRFHNQSLTLG